MQERSAIALPINTAAGIPMLALHADSCTRLTPEERAAIWRDWFQINGGEDVAAWLSAKLPVCQAAALPAQPEEPPRTLIEAFRLWLRRQPWSLR